MLAMVIFAGGIVSALMIYGLQYFSEQDQPATPQPQASQTAPVVETPSPRPSPTAVAQLPAPKEPDPVPPPAAEEKKQEIVLPVKKDNKPEAGELKALLVTIPAGATVSVDSKAELSCKTPCTMSLPAGRHTLSASASGYRRALRIFELPKEPEVVMNLDRTTGTVFIRSDPGGASISINGDARSEKTPATLALPTGGYKIEVSKSGYQTYVENIEVKDSVMTNIDVNWPAKAQ